MSPHRIAVGLVALLGLTGCPSIQSVQTAETVGEGNFQFAIEPGVIGVATDGGGGVLPTVNLSGRYGITDRFDLGGRFGTSLIELHGKVMFTDPADPEALQIAFAPQLGGIFVGAAGESAGYGWLNAPVLFDIPVGQHDIVVGPRVHTTFAGGGGGGGVLFSIGSSIGFAAKVGNTARILPELAVVVPLAGSISGGGTDFLGGGVIYTVNLGILLGGRDHSASE